MPFNSINDYISKYEQGNWWQSHYIRELNGPIVLSTLLGRWIDYSAEGTGTPNLFMGGNSLAANPVINNPENPNGLYTGPVPAAGQTKHLHSMQMLPGALGTTYFPMSFILCDYLMYYPNIQLSSSSKAVQFFDNTQSLPRYTDGEGVMAFLVIQNIPGTQGGSGAFAIGYTDSAGNENSIPADTGNDSSRVELVSFGAQLSYSKHIFSGSTRFADTSTNPGNCTPFIPLNTGSRGIRRINSFKTYSNYPGGTAAIVLCKPIACISLLSASTGVNALAATEKLFKANPPKIEEGACLHFLGTYLGSGSGNVADFRCNLTFVWG